MFPQELGKTWEEVQSEDDGELVEDERDEYEPPAADLPPARQTSDPPVSSTVTGRTGELTRCRPCVCSAIISRRRWS